MNLTFDNLDELNSFLAWADNYSSAQNVTVRVPATAFAACALVPGVNARAPSAGDSPEPTGVSGSVGFDTPPTGDAKSADAAEPTKRKRRTRAEIDAESAEAIRNSAAAQAATSEPAATAGANPFEVAPPENPHPDSEAAETEATDSEAETVVTPFQHLTRAREFIAKHGMPKYNESFTKAGLDANVMGYSAVQREKHMNALDELDKG